MAYINQEGKARIAAKVKPILQKYKLKGSLSISGHNQLVLTIRSGALDFIGNLNKTCGEDYYQVARGFTPITEGYTDVNPYHYDKHFSGRVLECVDALVKAMNDGNWDRSDTQTDYFDIGWFIRINIGRWNKPYTVEA